MDLLCETCTEAPPFESFEECLHCMAAVIVADPLPWESNRRWYVGAPWLAVLEREVERQRSALAGSEFMRGAA